MNSSAHQFLAWMPSVLNQILSKLASPFINLDVLLSAMKRKILHPFENVVCKLDALLILVLVVTVNTVADFIKIMINHFKVHTCCFPY